MRYLSANYIFPLHINPIKEGVVQVSKKGKVVNIFKHREQVPTDKLEIYEGVLCPGFVNVHCHLELSYLRGNILPQLKEKGLVNFISKIREKRKANNISKNSRFFREQIQGPITYADAIMQKNGIVAVGDVSNTDYSFSVKKKSKILYHTFVELFSLNTSESEMVFNKGLVLLKNCPKPNSITPHANYSVSKRLFSLLKNKSREKVICIHNQETYSEDELFEKGSGDLYEFLNQFGDLQKSGISSLKTSLLQMSKRSKIILVHNTFTKKEDVKWVKENDYTTYWCTCPKANLFIENKTPNYSIFDVDKLCVGTDSLASNDTLCILEELKILKEKTNYNLNTLLKIACKNGAQALNFKHLGTFEKGKIPGVNLINDLDFVKKII